jgi:hypothetical protein
MGECGLDWPGSGEGRALVKAVMNFPLNSGKLWSVCTTGGLSSSAQLL